MSKIKVLMVNHFPLIGSGSGVYVSNIAKNLVRLGAEVCIIKPENTTTGTTLDGVKTHNVFFKYIEKIDGQLPFNFPCFDPHPRSNETFYSLSEEQINEYTEAFRKAIQEEIEEFKPDIIHAQHIWILTNIISEYDIPFIITSHGSDIMGFKETTKYHDKCSKSIDKCKRIIAISDENKQEILKAYPNSKGKIEIIKNGYDKSVFYKKEVNKQEILKRFSINEDYKNIVVFAGRINENKGIDVLLKAAAKYEDNDTLTLIAGDGDIQFREKLINLSKLLGLRNTKFIGNQTHETLCDIYNIATVMAMPSREEAFGLSAIEALACGLPVIGTNSGGMVDFINNDVGALINVNDSRRLAKEIKNITNNKKILDREKIAKYALDGYAQENFMKHLIKIYKESLEGK